MADIDYGEACDFVDAAGRPHQLRFRRNFAPPDDPRVFDGTGQLIAVVTGAGRADHGDEIAISRPTVNQREIDAALHGWQDWATAYLDDAQGYAVVNLSLIQGRIQAAGLGPAEHTA
ncbi:hypothetical protein [Mycobacterium pseudokansasii]|uniref:hypothetical protein n=1 Tax=Mycobacterium pseudokansasii TaxID=2341080 RepID=UPI000F022BFF|nr:hypothetical protein [Mycobacterium pseudokansasii]VBA34487.1 hypothetical protein LAUMK35_05739 [Mycobacterium pseudokansasii]VBA35914.1 hypothetical protein LAUMK21_05722 [Mycobacterium pseudokansasii]